MLMSTMIELAVVAGGEEEVEVEVGEEGGGSDPGAVVDIGRKGTARDHNFRMKMGISQWMIRTARIFDCKVKTNYNFIEFITSISSRPYTSRSSSSGGGEGSTGRSVFNRLGGPAEGAFARLSGLGGDRRGESWHKVTVSMNECNSCCIAWPVSFMVKVRILECLDCSVSPSIPESGWATQFDFGLIG